MKLVYIIKKTPFLFTLVIIILISIISFSNQKENTKLKILIWNTPSLPLGTYLAISTITGYVISYMGTSSLANVNKLKYKKEIKYQFNDRQEQENISNETFNNISYGNTYIERDVKDPSPTLTASFRAIGIGNKKNEQLHNIQQNEYISSNFLDESDYQYNEQEINYKNDNQFNPMSNDWEDDSYTSW